MNDEPQPDDSMTIDLRGKGRCPVCPEHIELFNIEAVRQHFQSAHPKIGDVLPPGMYPELADLPLWPDEPPPPAVQTEGGD